MALLSLLLLTKQRRYCIDHKVWYGDYLRQESLLIYEDEPIEDVIRDLIEEVAARRKMLFVANIPYETKIPNIVYFLQDLGEVVSLRLIVDHRGEHVGCGFVEFASVNEAGRYKLAEKLWSKVENLLTVEEEEEETKPNLEKQESPMMGGCCGKKIIFSYDD